MKRPNQKRTGARWDNHEGPWRNQANCTTEIDASGQEKQGIHLWPSPSPQAILRTFLSPQIVECIRECVDRWLRGPCQQAGPSILARATASHMDHQERCAGHTRGHQQSQSRWQKEALRVPLPRARQCCGQCACAFVRAVGADWELTARAHVAGRAGANEAGEVGVAASAVGAGPRGARIRTLATVAAAEAQRAGAAARPATALQARAAVGAGAAGAVVQVVFAARPSEAGAAAAAQGVAQVQAEPACGGRGVRGTQGSSAPPAPLSAQQAHPFSDTPCLSPSNSRAPPGVRLR